MPAVKDIAELRMALIDAYRTEIKKRYDLPVLRKVRAFDNVPDEKLAALREFFVEHVYPPSRRREALDNASERVSAIFHSPRRLAPLTGLALGTLWRLGTMFPAAARVTATTLESLKETRLVEEQMLAYALDHELGPGDVGRTKEIAAIVASIPEKEMVQFRTDVLKLFRSLNSAALLKAGGEIMTRAIEVMGANPDTYESEDVEGFKLGRDLIEGSLRLFERLNGHEVKAIVNGIERIEIEWYNKMRQLAKRQ